MEESCGSGGVNLPRMAADPERIQLFKNLSAGLWDDLDEANVNSTFAGGSCITSFLHAFRVEGVGDLRLPLPSDDFQKLLGVSEQASDSHGSRTVDYAVARRAWQVGASKVTLPPDFSSRLRGFAISAVRELGLDGAAIQLEAHLYKLLLYEADGHFPAHRDAEKEPGMFATLLFQLPTEGGFEGGALHVRHGGITKTLDFSLDSASHAAYTVFYADCEHELQRITNGKRLCLAFNLVRGRNVSFDMQPRELKEFSSRLRKVEEALSFWRESLIITGARGARVQRGKKNKLALPLKHRYTKANLSFSGLKGKDRMVAHVLANCRDAGRPWLDMHLCILTLYMKGVAEENNYKRRRLELDSEGDDLIDTSDTTADLCVEESFTCSDWGEKIRNRQTVNYADDRIDDCHRMIDAKRPKITCSNWVDIHNMRCNSHQPRIKPDTEVVYYNEKQRPYYDEEGAGPDEVEFELRRDIRGSVLQWWYHTAMLVIWPKTKL